jgi:hypothetical protein
MSIRVIAGATTRYYCDGRLTIEESDGSDNPVRFRVKGTQYVGERVATWTDGGVAAASRLRPGVATPLQRPARSPRRKQRTQRERAPLKASLRCGCAANRTWGHANRKEPPSVAGARSWSASNEASESEVYKQAW